VTCRFWGDLWLNEGFASFMEYPAVAAVETDWDYVRIYQTFEIINILIID